MSWASAGALKSAFSLGLIDPQVGQAPAPRPFHFRDTSWSVALSLDRGSGQGTGNARDPPGRAGSVPILSSPLPCHPCSGLPDGQTWDCFAPEGTRGWNKGPLCPGGGRAWRRYIPFLHQCARACTFRPATAKSAHLFLIPCLVTSRWQFEIGLSGSIYTTEIGRHHHHQGLCVSGEPVVGHLPAHRLTPHPGA